MEIVQLVQTQFFTAGTHINYDPGKTELAFMFRGPRASDMRNKYFGPQATPKLVITTDTHAVTLRLVATYKHLGSMCHADGDLQTEVKHRINQAKQAFAETRRPVFCNKAIPVHIRIRLFQSLIESRLFYAIATWNNPNQVQTKLVDGMMMKCYRTIIGNGFLG